MAKTPRFRLIDGGGERETAPEGRLTLVAEHGELYFERRYWGSEPSRRSDPQAENFDSPPEWDVDELFEF